MSSKSESSNTSSPSNLWMTVALVLGQVGCSTLVIIFAGLFAGIWLDNRLETRPIFTVGLVIASIPITLIVMIFIVRRITARINKDRQEITELEEEITSGR